MRGPLIVVTGTGTGIGKTHVACALLVAAGRRIRVFGYKPIESGVDELSTTDSARLAGASTFHVKPPPPMAQLRTPVSPHLAARLEGVALDWPAMRGFVDALRAQGIALLVELPGGLFTPLTPRFRNVDAVASLEPSLTLLVGADRLGVLHDVGATLRAASSLGVTVSGVGLVTPEVADASTGTNADELRLGVDVPVFGAWPRASVAMLANDPTTSQIVSRWLD